MTGDDEGMNFISAFRQKFAADPTRTNERRKAERRANLTPKQRARVKGPPKTQKNFRASVETVAQLKALVKKTGKSETDVIAGAIDSLAKQVLGAKA